MKTLSIAVIFGLFGAVAVATSFALSWPTWVMFIAWVSYYIFGKTLSSSAIAFVQIVLGMVMGLLIQVTGIFLSEYLGGFGLPAAVFFFIGSLAFIMKVKPINNIPAWFLGLIIFFGMHPKMEPLPLLALLIPIVAGFLFAWLNDTAVHKVMQAPKAA